MRSIDLSVQFMLKWPRRKKTDTPASEVESANRMKSVCSCIFSLFVYLVPGVCESGVPDSRLYSPSNCEFSVLFPVVPVVNERVTRTLHTFQAQTPGDEFPWLVAQCTSDQEGHTAPPDVDSRAATLREKISEKARNVRTSKFRDARGEWAKAAGDMVIDGQPMTLTMLSVAGEYSLFIITSLTRSAQDVIRTEKFIADVRRNPDSPGEK